MTNQLKQLDQVIARKVKNTQQFFSEFPETMAAIRQAASNLGFAGVLRVIWEDLFAKRSLWQWLYLLFLTSIPVALAVVYPDQRSGLFGSLTGILCVILVAEGRASNYLFGFLSNVVYFALSFQQMFYGEVMTAVFFIVMQPVGLYFWLAARVKEKEEAPEEETHFETRKLTFVGWLKWLAFAILVWGTFGFIYASIGAKRPFRDSVTDGTNWTGQFLQSYLYREQWIFWIATNVFSIYLWWGASIQMQGMYWVYLINSLVGWYQWSKALKTQEG